jgi:hypothetical protein
MSSRLVFKQFFIYPSLGLIISNSQVKSLLDDYVRSQQQQPAPALEPTPASVVKEPVLAETVTATTVVEEATDSIKPELKRQMSSKSRRIRTSESADLAVAANSSASTSTLPRNLSEFTEFYIFDPESEMYISASEAFLKGMLIVLLTIYDI